MSHRRFLLRAAGSLLLAGMIPAVLPAQEEQPATQPADAKEHEHAEHAEHAQHAAHVPEEMALMHKIADMGSGERTRLPADYIFFRLVDREDSEEISQAFDRVLTGETEATLEALIKALEMDFVHSPDTSSLDLLNPELSNDHFGVFDWQENDYPGGEDGPNEKLADIMVDALDIVSPERRANRSRTAVILREEATEEVWDYLLAQWEPVPGDDGWKLNKHAVKAYVYMREAAAKDDVELEIMSGHRDPKRAAANAEATGNPYAVASFSSHSLGLAIDFKLPRAEGGRYRLTTSPMSDVVEMRKSPVHKWLHLYGYEYGWFPFQHEPWHWEYNPRGFREVFFADFPGGVPDREPGAQ